MIGVLSRVGRGPRRRPADLPSSVLPWTAVSTCGLAPTSPMKVSFPIACGSLLAVGCALGCVAEPKGDDLESAVDAITTLPYVRWVPAAAGAEEPRTGVTIHDPERAYPGLSLYCPSTAAEASLIDLEGREVHRWSVEGDADETFHHVELAPDGDLLAIVKDRRLIRLDRESEVVWSAELNVHHDLAFAESGEIYTLTRRARVVETRVGEVPILDDFITVLTPAGETVREISVYDLLGSHVPSERLRRILSEARAAGWPRDGFKADDGSGFDPIPDSAADTFHINSIEILDRDVPGFCRKGDLLISSRVLDAIAVVDPREERATWVWGEGVFDGQHHPRLLAGDTVLVFDNGSRRGFSRVVEIDPLTRETVWEYWHRRRRADVFFSASRGTAQRLPNGNTLVTESDRGRVFEITEGGETVWEFFSPWVRELEDGGAERAAIYRMERLIDPRSGWLQALAERAAAAR